MALTRRRLRGVSWQRLYKRKDEGGSGIHDISSFNQSLLAKQAWGILKKTQTIWWQESSKTSIDKRYGQRIGNGRTTRVWTENWIQVPTPRQPMYRPDAVVDLTLLVSDLLNPNTTFWNVQKVRQPGLKLTSQRAGMRLTFQTLLYSSLA